MNNILIHIGYHKTGTTWLQNELFIDQNEYFTPLSKNKKGHSTLARDFIYSNEDYLLSPFSTNDIVIKKNLQELSSKLLSNKIPVLSHERLSGNPHSSGFDAKNIADRLNYHFSNAKILIIIREQVSWVVSNYFQYLSIGGNHNLDQYLNTKYDGKRPHFSPHHIEYHYLIAYYQKLFGHNNVLVLPYELINTNKITFFNTLSGYLNIDIDITKLNTTSRHNNKEDLYSQYANREQNAKLKPSSVNNYRSNKETSGLMSLWKKRKEDKVFKQEIKNKVTSWMGNRYKTSNAITQEITGIDLKTLKYSL